MCSIFRLRQNEETYFVQVGVWSKGFLWDMDTNTFTASCWELVPYLVCFHWISSQFKQSLASKQVPILSSEMKSRLFGLRIVMSYNQLNIPGQIIKQVNSRTVRSLKEKSLRHPKWFHTQVPPPLLPPGRASG